MTDDPTARLVTLRDDLLLDVPPHGRQRVDNHTLNSWLTADDSGVMPISAGKAIIRDLLVTREIAVQAIDVALAAVEYREAEERVFRVKQRQGERGIDWIRLYGDVQAFQIAARDRLDTALAALEEA